MQRKLFGSILIATSLFAGVQAFAAPIDAMIKLKDNVSMASLAESVMDTSSPRYGKFYSPAEIRQLAAPNAQDYATLLKNLKQEGFTIVSESKTHLWVTLRADASLFQSVFGTEFNSATSATGENLHQLTRAAVVPNRFSLIESVGGLDNTRKSHPHYVLGMARAKDSSIPGFSPDQIKAAYGFNPIYQAGINGVGQHIAVATYDGFKIDEVNTYYSTLNITPTPVVDQVNFNGTATYNYQSATETQLDAEFSGMIAPGANIHVFTSAANSDLGELQLFTAILDDNRSKVVNYSWGDCEANLTPAHVTEMTPVFQRAIAQGVNLLAAAGDSGSDGCNNKTLSADWPAANPYIVAVGGTTLTISSSNQKSETAWSGSGGGISVLFDLPSWQQALPAPYTKRSFPDVAFNADPNSGQSVYADFYGIFPMWEPIGGTSMAAPQWSGFVTLVGAARQKAGKTPLGFLNPFIYLMSAQDRSQSFSDVTSGSNGAYSAGPGWDAVTGWGSMQASELLNYLVAQ